jgi:outer membrane protein OmpU
MKKVLIASTALVAATMVSAGAASASEKIKLNLGGYSKWWVVAAQQQGAYKDSQVNNAGQFAAVDVKGDNEVYFGGSTTLDNGLKVGIDIQLEAGGHSDTRATATTDVIDESYVFIEGGFGKFIVGSKNNGTYLIHNTAPDAAGNWNEGGIITGSFAVAQPAGAGAGGANRVASIGQVANDGANATASRTAGVGNTTAILTDGDSEGITYVSPTFYGFTAGASYKPNGLTEDSRGTESGNLPVYGAGILYANTFGGVGVKADVGYAQYNLSHVGTASATGVVGSHGLQRELSSGAQLSYAGFTLGGSYRQVIDNMRNDTALNTISYDATAWDIGLQYASGPYAVSVAYFQSKAEDLIAVSGEDKIEFYQISGKYNLGAGVDTLATIGHASYKDEAGAAAGKNEGWTGMVGLSLAF